LKLLKAGKVESTTTVDPEGSYMSTDRRDLGRRVEGGKKRGTGDSIVAIDCEAASRGRKSMNRRDCGAKTCSNDNIP
jgi:hypothetical protein